MTPEEAATKRRKQEKKRKRREQPLSVAKTSSTTQLTRSVPGDVSEAAVVSLATAHGGAPKAHKQAGAPEGAQNRPKKAKKPKFAPGQTSQASEAVSLQKDAATAKPTSFRASLPNGLQQHYCAVGDRTLAQSRPAILKQLYKEHLDTAGLSEAQVSSWRSERSITLSGTDLRPVTAFDRAGFPSEVLQVTKSFSTPSPIQAQCWPIVLSGQDVIGIAATGSGKTHAFGLPAICHILAQSSGKAQKGQPRVLVLAPTRELAHQTMEVLSDAGGRCGLACVSATGGSPKKVQVRDLRKGADVVVATPGRLQDLVDDDSCRLDGVTYLVLDEADRMLDLGFEPAIRAIAGGTRADRQTLMFSATWPASIQQLAAEFLCNPARVTIGSSDLSASHSVQQIVEVIEPADRDARLEALLRKHHASRSNRILVFALYKKEAARVGAMLERKGWKVASIHGDLSQPQRTAAMQAFKDGSIPLLVATDVAARGLDIPDVELVINYSFPLTSEDYCHRIGRTGRAGKTGISHTFFSGATDRARAGELINVLQEAEQPVPAELLRFGTTVKKKEHKLFGNHFKEIDPMQKSSKVTFDFDE